MNKGYFEGTLQLRNITKEIRKFVNNSIERNNIYIASRKKLKNGFDMKISSNKWLMSFGKELKSKFTGNLKISRKLFSQDRQTGKKIWRLTVYFSYFPHKVGDKVMIKGDDYIIKRLGDKVHVSKVDGGKKKFFDYEEI